MSKKNKINLAIFIIAIIIIVLVVMLGNNISKKQNTEPSNAIEEIDVFDIDNVVLVDEKLKNGDYRVTQPYLFNYLTKKSALWYSSHGKVTKVKKSKSVYLITVASENDKNKKLVLESDKKVNFKKNDLVYFVGNIDLESERILLTTISKENIDYQSVYEISVEDLHDNIYYIKNTYVLVSGYMITEGKNYKLFANKTESKKEETLIKHFDINWAEEFKYTGNKDVLLRCFIGDRYTLIGCELEE